MDYEELSLKGLKLLKPKVFHDDRGFFLESYRKSAYHNCEITVEFVQDNHSYSKYGTIRGMHFQSEPGQDKLIRVVKGKIYDVAVDVRPDSETFGKWEGVYLDETNHHQLFVPVGFAHGFCTVSEEAHVLYKVSAPYNSETEKGFRFDDPTININWPIEKPLISKRDQLALRFTEVF